MKDRHEGVQRVWEKYKYVILVTLVGMGLLLWPEQSQERKETAVPMVPASELQREMEAMLETMEGVGQVRVLLTQDTDGERLLAQDTDLSYSGNVEAPERYERSSEIIMRNGTGGDEPMIIRTLYPTYRGALIVCQGGDQPEVKLSVTAAVMALTGLPSDRISVEKYQ